MKYKIYCSLCGAENYPLLKYCDNCGRILKTYKIKEQPKYDSIELFFTEENRQLLINTPLPIEIYDKIISNIREIGLMNLKLNENESCLNRVFRLVQQFSKIHYNKKDGCYGYYTCNNIFLDDDLEDCVKIATLIHELAHHLYSEIFEQILMYMFDSKKSTLYEAFVLVMSIQNRYLAISNEFLAYTTEGYFTNNLKKDYGSVIEILQETNMDLDLAQNAYVIGKSIAVDVIKILEVFIPENLRQEIVELAVRENVEPEVVHELDNVEVVTDPQEKVDMLKGMLVTNFSYFIDHPEEINRVDAIVHEFRKIDG